MAYVSIGKALSAPRPNTPTVTISNASEVRLSAAALRLLGSPDAVRCFVDTDTRSLALRAAEPNEPDLHPLSVVKSAGSGRRFATALLKQRYGFSTERQVFTPQLDDEGRLVCGPYRCEGELTAEDAEAALRVADLAADQAERAERVKGMVPQFAGKPGRDGW